MLETVKCIKYWESGQKYQDYETIITDNFKTSLPIMYRANQESIRKENFE